MLVRTLSSHCGCLQAFQINKHRLQIYYQTFGNWGTVDIDVNATEYTITSLWASYTYNITLVALFPNATVGHKVIMPGTYLSWVLRDIRALW